MTKVTFLTGHSARRGLLGIAAFPQILDDEAEFTRFYTTMDDRWMQLEFEFDVRSVTYLNLPDQHYQGWWLLGKRGEVVEVVGGKPRIDQIETAGTGPGEKYGNLFQIRAVVDELLICGHGRQVYHRRGGHWHLISADILDTDTDKPAEWFRSIDGFSMDELYAVGSEGEIWRFDGTTWRQCDSPTNHHLTDVRCIDENVWACGAGGVILCGRNERWEVIWDQQEPVERWWNLESFRGKIYVANNRFLGTFEGDEILPVDVGIRQNLTTGTLHQKEGILWSIGAENILAYDGEYWKEVICPDNQ